MDGLQPYPAYKDSGLPWLGRVPATWEAHCLRTLTRMRNERGCPELPLLSVLREKGVVPRSSLAEGENHNFIPDDLSNYKVAREGNLVINKMKAWQGSMGIAPCDGIVSPAYYVFDFRIEDRRYGQWLLRSRPYVDFFARMSDGVRIGQWDLSISGMRQIPLPVPPSEEQAAIVRYLDHATRKIDKAIRAKRKIITLLNEQKQATIHRAVTRGLDPDVPLKDSGIPWLGQIPAHWDVALNQRIFRETIRPHQDQPETQLSLSQRSGLIATANMEERSLQTASFDNWKLVLPDDLVLNRFKAHLGVFFAATLRGIVSFHYGVFAPKRGVVSKYYELLYHTTPYRAIYAGRSNGMTVGLQNLSNQNFYNVRSPIPPAEEQLQIVEHVASVTAEPENVISRIRREIELLAEYRTRLIADVVTGKLDVRAAAGRLPEPKAEATPEIAEAEDDKEALEEAA